VLYTSRVEALEHKRAVRKGAQPRSNLSAWPCDSCPRVSGPELDCTPINKLTDHMRSFVFDGAVRPSYIRIGNGCVVTSSLVVDRQILRLPINANVPIQKHRILCRKIGIWATVRSKVKRKPAANQN